MDSLSKTTELIEKNIGNNGLVRGKIQNTQSSIANEFSNDLQSISLSEQEKINKLNDFNNNLKEHLQKTRERFNNHSQINRDKVIDLSNNPKKLLTEIDEQGDVCITFPEIQLSVKPINVSLLSHDQHFITKDGEIRILNASTLTKIEFFRCIHAAEQGGYYRNDWYAQVIMSYLSTELGLPEYEKQTHRVGDNSFDVSSVSFRGVRLASFNTNYHPIIPIRMALWKTGAIDITNYGSVFRYDDLIRGFHNMNNYGMSRNLLAVLDGRMQEYTFYGKNPICPPYVFRNKRFSNSSCK